MKIAFAIAFILLFGAPSVGHASMRVVLLDTGVTVRHPELAGRIDLAGARTFIDDGRGIRDCNGHGTAVASIIAGSRVGLAPSATLTPVRMLDCEKRTTAARVIRALRYVIAQRQAGEWSGPTVINASFALPRDARVDELVDELARRGVPTITSAGNVAGDACRYSPAHASTSITIGAYETTRRPYWSSNTGPCVDYYASAHRFGATPPAGYKHRTGTSISAAIATGIVARANSVHLTTDEARRILDRYSVREAWGRRLDPRLSRRSSFPVGAGAAAGLHE